MALRVGVDIGGTFTDVFVFAGERSARGKADTTHFDLRLGFMNAAQAAAEKLGYSLEELLREADFIGYSTTIGTNALIERKGPRLGLITTHGFEDTILVGRSRNWADGLPPEVKYDRGRARRPEPLIPRDLIVGVRERIDNLGNVVIPLRDDDVIARVQELVDKGVRGIVVVLLHAYVNPVHEQRIRDIIRREYPESYLGYLPVFLSSEVSPQIGEYRRTMTVVLDAYLRVETEQHLVRLADDLRDAGYRRPMFLVKNTGGVSSLSRTQPLHLFGSSPVATVIGSSYVAEQLGIPNAIVTDMGGTTFDVGLVVEGQGRVYELDPIVHRWRVQVPIVAHWSIGAGGGSIARVVEGRLKVGPDSAGSNPGPACYARGGTDPTVTDADVVLGYINPNYFLGGRLRLDPERAKRAVREKVAAPLGLSELEAAWNIKKLIDGVMGQEIYRICAYHSGQDPREFVIFAHGGAGPVHAAGFAPYVDVGRIAMFPFSSVFGAFGTLCMDVLQVYERSVHIILSPPGGGYIGDAAAAFNEQVQQLLALAERDLVEEGFDRRGVFLVLEALLCYGQQRHQLPVPVGKLQLESEADVADLCQRFNDLYRRSYGRGSAFPEAGIEVVRLRVSAVGPLERFSLRRTTPRPGTLAEARKGSRVAFWGPEHGEMETPVYHRDAIGPGAELTGPALLEADDTVVVVPPGWLYRVDAYQIGWLEHVKGG